MRRYFKTLGIFGYEKYHICIDFGNIYVTSRYPEVLSKNLRNKIHSVMPGLDNDQM